MFLKDHYKRCKNVPQSALAGLGLKNQRPSPEKNEKYAGAFVTRIQVRIQIENTQETG